MTAAKTGTIGQRSGAKRARNETMKNAEVAKRLADAGINVVLSDNPAAFRKFWEAENQRFGKVIKDANIPTE